MANLRWGGGAHTQLQSQATDKFQRSGLYAPMLQMLAISPIPVGAPLSHPPQDRDHSCSSQPSRAHSFPPTLSVLQMTLFHQPAAFMGAQKAAYQKSHVAQSNIRSFESNPFSCQAPAPSHRFQATRSGQHDLLHPQQARKNFPSRETACSEVAPPSQPGPRDLCHS